MLKYFSLLFIFKFQWAGMGKRFEAIQAENKISIYMVTENISYADILMAHLVTWITEVVNYFLTSHV